MSDLDITLYLNELRVRALADALGNQTAETVEDKPEMHQRLMNIRGSVAGRTRFILSDSPSEMNVPLKIDEELYFEGKFDSEYLMKMLTKRVLDRIGYDYSGIVVTLRPSDYIGAAETDEPAEIADEDEAEGFGMQLL